MSRPSPPAARRRRSIRRLLLLVALTSPVFAGAAEAPASCRRVTFAQPPVWTSSLSWRPAGGWILADAGSGEIRLLAASGDDAGRVVRPGGGPFEFNKPVAVVAVDRELLLRDGGDHWLWLDEDLEPHRQLRLDETPTAEGEIIGSPYAWAVTADARLLGYLHVYQPDETWWTGLAEVTLTAPPHLRRLLELDRFLPVAKFHTLALPTVASVSGRGYFLQLDQPVHVLETPSMRRLTGVVPAPLRRVPSLPPLRMDTVGLAFRLIERQPLAAGLISDRGRLFLLERAPEEQGTRWRLHQLDLVADRVARTLTLPTRAHWIVVAPGPEDWAILEKGPVEGILEQPVHGLALVPRRWIDEPATPLAADLPPRCDSSAGAAAAPPGNVAARPRPSP